MSNQYESRSKMSDADYARYRQTRRELYPTTHGDKYPSAEAKRDYDRYAQRTHEANASESRYWEGYEKHTGSPNTPIETLSQRQHKSMLPSAAEVATDTLTHAQARDSFLEDHPHAYHTAQVRKDHEKFTKSAYRDAAYYRDRYSTHQSGSTESSLSFAPLGAKEPYWQLDRITGQYCHIDRDGTVIWENSREHSSSLAARRR